MAQTARSDGFTLVEMLITMAIIGSTVALAAPTLADVMRALAVHFASGNLKSDLLLARVEAVRRNGRVVVCKSDNATQCNPTGTWERGWIVFHDRNNSMQVDPGEDVIHAQGPLGNGIAVCGNKPVQQFVSYSPTGRAQLQNGSWQFGSLYICSTASMGCNGYRLGLDANGRVREYKSAKVDC